MNTIIHEIRKFRRLRKWEKFHSPKNLSMSIAIEAGELMELFQWLSEDESHQVDKDRVSEELADVLIYCFNLADILEFNIKWIMLDKILKNQEKYPIKD